MNLLPQANRTRGMRVAALLTAVGLILAIPAAASAQSAATLYQRGVSREAAARKAPTVASLRSAISSYEQVVRSYPRSGYCDDALWHGAVTARFAWERFGQTRDLTTAKRLLNWLKNEYPASKWVRQVPGQLAELSPAPKPAPTRPAPSAPNRSASATIRHISRSPLPNGDRLTIELDREVITTPERITDPDRLFFDLPNTEFDTGLAASLQGLRSTRLATVRVGRQEERTARVVLALAGGPRHSVFLQYHPFRIVIDIEGGQPPVVRPSSGSPIPGQKAPEPALPPAPPSATSTGEYSLSRQLGLGISRIVIDAGHGGHDPGAQANGLVESELVLDIAQRVERLLKTRPGIDVVLTRTSDVFIPLEERTALANREGADLFLSIHANASRRVAAKGVETYFLNFATNADAEAVAARENAGSRTSMAKLQGLVEQIALHDKMKESREFAQIVQTNMVRGIRSQNKGVVDLGVKQAPFVVLIGAQMPSVLAEISFVTNKPEATLLKKDTYRQRIAQALVDAVLRYQTSLKQVTTIAVAGGR